ncbi:hypothetical protein PFISCL1PPCAC_19290, partial [Pristionchus fissidentatus]
SIIWARYQNRSIMNEEDRVPGASYVTIPDSENWDESAEKKRKEIEEEEKERHSTMPPSTSSGVPSSPSVSSSSGSKEVLPGYAFCLPNLDRLPSDFRSFLERDLIEVPTQRRLENSRHLNWWNLIGARLWPLSTTGDGNCLLHAASLGMWGLHDRQLLLRNALYEILLRGSRRNALWRRWKWAESKANEAAGLQLTDEEWATEWRSVVELAAPTPRKTDDSSASSSSDQIYEGLEAIHVFALAHVLKRPIVVVSDTVLRNANGEELSPIGFGGVYLPLECPPEQCHRSPLVLCYDSAHFSPLVCMKDESTLQQIIPMIDANRNLLPLHFAVDPGPDFTWWRDEEDERMAERLEQCEADRLAYMNEYMDLVRIDVRRGSARKTTPIRRETSVEKKSMTLGSTGVSSNGAPLEKKRILNEITQQVRRTLRLSTSKNKENALDVKMCIDALARTNCIVAAKLNATSHEYIEEIVTEYIKVARERFANSKEKQTGRARLGRSFSASSLNFSCINNHCDQAASQATNFFCQACLERQKALMTSFSSDGTRTMRRMVMHNVQPSTSGGEREGGEKKKKNKGAMKSTTMPSFSSERVERDRRERERKKIEEEERNKQPMLFAVSSDGAADSVPLSAVADENGVTHYYLSDAENNPIDSAPSTLDSSHSRPSPAHSYHAPPLAVASRL